MTDDILERANQLQYQVITAKKYRDAATECIHNGMEYPKLFSKRTPAGEVLECPIPSDVQVEISNILYDYYDKLYDRLITEFHKL